MRPRCLSLLDLRWRHHDQPRCVGRADEHHGIEVDHAGMVDMLADVPATNRCEWFVRSRSRARRSRRTVMAAYLYNVHSTCTSATGGEFHVIASDAGLISTPFPVKQLVEDTSASFASVFCPKFRSWKRREERRRVKSTGLRAPRFWLSTTSFFGASVQSGIGKEAACIERAQVLSRDPVDADMKLVAA